ncbi:MAG: EscU/YscU/HrcU family type secretion system export apparatus switch protein [Ilumatobacteraceae bacterium]|nr:EscU/YscU/HrcU family type secretion system export apparatus switch protein [Ilumatobacteraceae bacterium]
MGKRDGKTEQATARKRREAKREGQLPRSQETNTMLVTIVAAMAMISTAPSALRTSGTVMHDWLANADGKSGLRFGSLVSTVGTLVTAWGAPVLAAAGAGMVATVAQGGIVLMPKTSRPSLKSLSWSRGLAQLNPKKASYTLLRNLLKFAVVGGAMVSPVQQLWNTLPRASGLASASAMTGRSINTILMRVIGGAILIAALDQVVTRRKWRRDLMMSKQEIIDEAKMSEGDPHAKAARKRRGMELRRRRSTMPISMADVIITNPTHFAVALSYAEGSVAPQVIGKGTERMAKQIRREASRHGVPIIENRPLARALYRQVPVGGYVPEKFFDDVVKVLVAAYWRRGKIPGHVAGNQSSTQQTTLQQNGTAA